MIKSISKFLLGIFFVCVWLAMVLGPWPMNILGTSVMVGAALFSLAFFVYPAAVCWMIGHRKGKWTSFCRRCWRVQRVLGLDGNYVWVTDKDLESMRALRKKARRR